MHRFVVYFAAILLLFASLSSEASARTTEDEGLWFMLAAQGNGALINETFRDFRGWLDVQPRLTQSSDGLEQMLIRPGLGYAVRDNVSVWLGYAWIRTKNESRHSELNLIWQQLTWSPKIEWFDLASRTRLEQRFQEGDDEAGWRFRQFVKGTKPLAAQGRLFLSVYEEVFFDFNDTKSGQRAGFAQNRVFAGIGWKFDRDGRIRSEVGYLNQLINRSAAPDRMNHLLSINLFLNY